MRQERSVRLVLMTCSSVRCHLPLQKRRRDSREDGQRNMGFRTWETAKSNTLNLAETGHGPQPASLHFFVPFLILVTSHDQCQIRPPLRDFGKLGKVPGFLASFSSAQRHGFCGAELTSGIEILASNRTLRAGPGTRAPIY